MGPEEEPEGGWAVPRELLAAVRVTVSRSRS